MNNTKEYIMKTSLGLFLKKSFKDVTMKEIVEKTGLSKGAFYHYFNSKEELFKETAQMFMASGIIQYKSFPEDSLKAFYTAYAEYIGQSFKEIYTLTDNKDEEKTSLNFFFIMFEAVSKFPEFLKLEREQYKNSLEAWKKRIKHAKQSGEITSESSNKDIADLFLYCTDGVFIRYVNSDHKISYEKELIKAFESIYDNIKS